VTRATLDPGAASRCAYRTVLEHDQVDPVAGRVSPEVAALRRVEAAREHRRAVAATLLALHGDRALDAARDVRVTLDGLARHDLDVLVDPLLPPDAEHRRHGVPALLVADRGAGADAGGDAGGAGVSWRAVDVHNHFLTDEGTGRFWVGSLAAPTPASATLQEGRRLRRGGAWHRDLLRLAHHQRRLESLGAATGARPFGGVIDRGGTLWWLPLDTALDDRGSALAQYDARFAERVSLLDATEARADDPSQPRPGEPWWHRECEECPFAGHCHGTLSAHDDVSLVRFTGAGEQALLRDLGVATRRSLAALDLRLVARGVATRDEPSEPDEPVAVSVGRRVRDAERLVRRARVEVTGSMLRLVATERLDARRRDVEVDFDMESYDNATYLWGATVTLRRPVAGLDEGYVCFAEWGELTDAAEAALFARFYDWLSATVATARAAGRSVGLYCFWEHAERAQMRRALAIGGPGMPSAAELDGLLVDLIDVHQVVTSQLQTAGPAGLKVLATAAGFAWRDEAPSGEASMAWYEEARGADQNAAAAATRRLLEYNEDDCRATRALRDWLEGPARELPDVEGVRPADS
jgi:predicted RecB family nuclease